MNTKMLRLFIAITLFMSVIGFEVAIDGKFLRVPPKMQHRRAIAGNVNRLPDVPMQILQKFFDPSYTERLLE